MDELDTYFSTKHEGLPDAIDWNVVIVYAVEEIKKLKAVVIQQQQELQDLRSIADGMRRQ